MRSVRLRWAAVAFAAGFFAVSSDAAFFRRRPPAPVPCPCPCPDPYGDKAQTVERLVRRLKALDTAVGDLVKAKTANVTQLKALQDQIAQIGLPGQRADFGDTSPSDALLPPAELKDEEVRSVGGEVAGIRRELRLRQGKGID